ncbi:hypothetical protein [Streptomyces sp. NRRL WC-3725]|uniref:hypothetical protein n=1 Tax=Streptomyces sp. NRRL WC-3725 TaxID=1463933 RepID=UPI003B63D87B
MRELVVVVVGGVRELVVVVVGGVRELVVVVVGGGREPVVVVVGGGREPHAFGRRPRAVHHPPQGSGGQVEAALQDGPHARPVVAQGPGRYDGPGRPVRETGTGGREKAPG